LNQNNRVAHRSQLIKAGLENLSVPVQALAPYMRADQLAGVPAYEALGAFNVHPRSERVSVERGEASDPLRMFKERQMKD